MAVFGETAHATVGARSNFHDFNILGEEMPDSRNFILRSLPPEQRERITAAAEFVELPKRRLLYDINTPIKDVYFIETGVASIVSVLTDNTAVETSTCGREGMVGVSLFLGVDTTATQALQQIPGTAWRLPAAAFLEELERGPELRNILGRYVAAQTTLIGQHSACNRRHSIEERCVRWLLQSHDQMGGEPFELTHQFWSQMLGVRRATVTVTAGALQQAGLISYHRGIVTIKDRAGLENIVCECYAIVRNEFAKHMGSIEPVEDPLRRTPVSDGEYSTIADGA
jgi:CRP-like cAMP-binding protein